MTSLVLSLKVTEREYVGVGGILIISGRDKNLIREEPQRNLPIVNFFVKICQTKSKRSRPKFYRQLEIYKVKVGKEGNVKKLLRTIKYNYRRVPFQIIGRKGTSKTLRP